MKKLLTIVLITIGSLCYGQDWAGNVPVVMRKAPSRICSMPRIIVSYYKDGVLIYSHELPCHYSGDSLTSERFFEDSIGNSYLVEYKYADDDIAKATSDLDHRHHISNCSIVKFQGNKQKTIFSNIKAIYSPVECVSDNRELWLKRLYWYQNNPPVVERGTPNTILD